MHKLFYTQNGFSYVINENNTYEKYLTHEYIEEVLGLENMIEGYKRIVNSYPKNDIRFSLDRAQSREILMNYEKLLNELKRVIIYQKKYIPVCDIDPNIPKQEIDLTKIKELYEDEALDLNL